MVKVTFLHTNLAKQGKVTGLVKQVFLDYEKDQNEGETQVDLMDVDDVNNNCSNVNDSEIEPRKRTCKHNCT